MSYHLLTDAAGISGYVSTKEQREEYNRRKRYRRGALPANYPVPAIRYEWEWMCELGTGAIDLFLITYGVFDG